MAQEIVNLFIDDRPASAPKGAMVIEVADHLGIDIPRFCYHRKLSVAANCRMCLVEVEKEPKPLPACATPVVEGMKVFTKSKKALDAQHGTMEFLLINHPLDCPVCDQGGECELQDVAMGYGKDVSRYTEAKRVVKDKNLGPLVSTDMTRCIHCTRCVRFGEEIAGVKELGATGRGEFMEIGTFVEHSIHSELSGNIIDLCPVGALNAKPSRMQARAWEMVQHASVAPHDSVGSNIYLHVLRNKVVRVVPREKEEINECWISDRDRFSYEGIYSEDRALQPQLKVNNRWQHVAWETALQHVATTLRKFSPQDIGVLVGAHSTLEDMYMLQHFCRSLGIINIDHRSRQVDFTNDDHAPLFPWLGQSISDLETVDAGLIIGSHVRYEQPILAHRLRKAAKRKGAKMVSINPRRFEFYFPNEQHWTVAPQNMVSALLSILKVISKQHSLPLSNQLAELIDCTSAHPQAQQAYEYLSDGEHSTVLLGAIAICHPQYSLIQLLAYLIARATNSRFGYLPQAANTAGAWLAGVLPHRLPGGKPTPHRGLNARLMFEEPRKGYILFNTEPELDCDYPAQVLNALDNAEFVVNFTPFLSSAMQDYATTILPITTFAEMDGTFVNAEGRWQTVAKAVDAPSEVRAGWRIVRALANQFDVKECEYFNSTEILEEVQHLFAADQKFSNELSVADYAISDALREDVYRSGQIPIYATDNLVRRAKSLQQTPHANMVCVRVHPDQAKALNLTKAKLVVARQQKYKTKLPIVVDESVPVGSVWIDGGQKDVSMLGSLISPVELERIVND